MSVSAPRGPARLWAYALFGAVLSGAGLPIYIFAPKFFADTYGVSLTALGVVLFALRLFDVVQDPLMGWFAERLRHGRVAVISFAALVLAASMLALFAIAPPVGPLWWFGIAITGLFSAFSFLSICFYAQGVAKAKTLGDDHFRLAAWRETGALVGVCLSAVGPSVLLAVTGRPYAAFAWGFAAVAVLAALAMMREWADAPPKEAPTPIHTILSDVPARRLLILALVNATPLAVSSTLFLFFVESALDASGWEGPLLLLFFLAAAGSAPFWSAAARRYGPRLVLLIAMVLSVASFATVALLGPGDILIFAAISFVGGATIGADLTLLPALFSRRMAAISPNAAQGFGLWSFVSKFTLAFAAAVLLPTLDVVGFVAGGENDQSALRLLTYLYALAPCGLKLLAIALLARLPLEDS